MWRSAISLTLRRPSILAPPPRAAARFFSSPATDKVAPPATTLRRPSPATEKVAAPATTLRRPPPARTAARLFASPATEKVAAPTTTLRRPPPAEEEKMSEGEVRKLMRLVNVEALKKKLAEEGKEVIGYSELLKACESSGVVRNVAEAAEFAKMLDDAGVVVLFRDRVYLHPDKVVDVVSRSVPLALTSEDDPRREELKRLQEQKEEIDRQAHKQVRSILWSGLGFAVLQVGLFFRLTFWEFSWDVMEPVAFFTTATGLVISYGYFMFTSKDPTYRDLMKTLFLSRQRKLLKKHNFDIVRFNELRDRCKCPLDKNYMNKNLTRED